MTSDHVASGERGAADHPAADEFHPLVAELLVQLPDDELIAGYDHGEGPEWVFAAQVATRQAIVALRWVARSMRVGDDERANLRAEADRIEAAR